MFLITRPYPDTESTFKTFRVRSSQTSGLNCCRLGQRISWDCRLLPKIQCAERYCHSTASVNRKKVEGYSFIAQPDYFVMLSRASAWSVVTRDAPSACSVLKVRFPSTECRFSIASRTTETRRPRSSKPLAAKPTQYSVTTP